MGKCSSISKLKALISINGFRHDLDRNLVKMVEVESKIEYLNKKTIA
jgi:hypothetical protein